MNPLNKRHCCTLLSLIQSIYRRGTTYLLLFIENILRLHPTEDVLVMSTVKFKQSDLGSLGRLCLFVLPKLGLTKMTVDEDEVKFLISVCEYIILRIN